MLATVLIFGMGTCLTITATKKPTIAFYNIPDSDAEKIQKEIGSGYAFKVYNADRPLSWELSQGATPDMIITTTGNACTDAVAAAKKVTLDTSVLKDMTTSVRTLAQQNKASPVVPLLVSHIELAVHTSDFKKSGVKAINSWGDFERFATAAAEKSGKKILFAGKDSNAFLDMLGAMAESIDGVQNYKNTVELIDIALDKTNSKKEAFNAQKLTANLTGTPDSPLYNTVRMLHRWYTDGLLFSEAFSIDQKSIAALMANNTASAVIMSLHDHRAIEHSVIEKYSSIYFPSNIPAFSRAFTAPLYVAVPLKNNKDVLATAKQLVATAKQEQLSRSTGLAPVLARCRTPDKQADDVRYWVAATNEPLAGLSRDISLTHSQKDLLAAELAAVIRFGDF